MTQLRDILLCLLLIVALAFGLVLRHQFKTTAQLRSDLSMVTQALATEQRLRESDVGSLTTRLQLAEKARLQKEKRDAKATKALHDNPDWARQRVPDDVIDALGM